MLNQNGIYIQKLQYNLNYMGHKIKFKRASVQDLKIYF